ALDTTVDYLINSDTDEKAKSTLKDTELQQFKAIQERIDLMNRFVRLFGSGSIECLLADREFVLLFSNYIDKFNQCCKFLSYT
ncbi:MAG: hypothetical protein WCE64_04765, partial [Bacteroidales bacterium]